VASAEHGGGGDATAFVTGGLENGEGFAAEEVGVAEGTDGAAEVMERAGRGDEAFESWIVLEDAEGEAVGCGEDARAGNGRVQGRDERRGVDGRAERGWILQQEEVAEAGERRRRWGEGALECGECGEGCGLGYGGDGVRISREALKKLLTTFPPLAFIPSGAKAHNFIGLSTYGLKPVPFRSCLDCHYIL